MKRLMSMLAIAGLCSVGSALAAQMNGKPGKKDQYKEVPATYTGCVARGQTKAIAFLLKDATTPSGPKATYDLRFNGLAAHVGHEVQVTGRVFKSVDNLYGTLWAKSLKMVANKCS